MRSQADARRCAPWIVAAITLGVLATATPAHAQIWVVTAPDGSQRFTTSPEPGAHVYMQTRATRTARVGSVGLPGNVPYAEAIASAAAENGIEPSLVSAVIAAESNFNPRAVSSKGALGLMQLMPATAAELGVSNVWDPEQNIRGGTTHLARLLSKYGDVSLALAAYNAGEGTVERHGGIPPFAETRQYVDRVLGTYRRLQAGQNIP